MCENGLPVINRFITDHDSEGKAVFSSQIPESLEWENVGGIKDFALAYTTTSFPVKLQGSIDMQNYETHLQKKPGVMIRGGTVLRYVDLGPGATSPMHRTISLDYGVVIEGRIELILDSGESRIMNQGDVAIQRATAHEWRNTSKTESARLLFCLQEAEPIIIKGKPLAEDYGHSMPGVQPS